MRNWRAANACTGATRSTTHGLAKRRDYFKKSMPAASARKLQQNSNFGGNDDFRLCGLRARLARPRGFPILILFVIDGREEEEKEEEEEETSPASTLILALQNTCVNSPPLL
jgi:hypothetical protein